MELPIEIKNIIEQEAQNYKMSDLILTSQKISENYLNKNPIVKSKTEVLSYSIMRMPATYGAVTFSLNKMLENIDAKIESILDIGSGTGSSLIASKNLIKNCDKFYAIEQEKEMINLSKKLVENIEYQNENILNLETLKSVDLIVSSYMLNELPESELFNTIDKIILASKKYILIVEPGTPESSEKMRKIRDYILSKSWHIIAPCSHENLCPISSPDWCHFVTRIQRNKLHKLLKGGNAPYEDEKFTFLALSKAPIKKDYSRVLRHPLINSGFIKLELCNNDGNISNITVTKKEKEKFKIARKINAGDKYIY